MKKNNSDKRKQEPSFDDMIRQDLENEDYDAIKEWILQD